MAHRRQKKARGSLSARAFAAFYLMQRPTCYTGSFLQHAARFYEAYILDQYCKVESQRLQYIEHNQEKLRCHLHSGLEDAAQKGDCERRRSDGVMMVLVSDGDRMVIFFLYFT